MSIETMLNKALFFYLTEHKNHLKLVAGDYSKDNSLRFRIIEFIPAGILYKKRKHNF